MKHTSGWSCEEVPGVPVDGQEERVTPLDRRVRFYGLVSRTVPGLAVASMPDDRLPRVQHRAPPHNRVLDALFGRVAPGVAIADRTIPGPGGDLPVRTYTPSKAGVHRLVVHFHGGGWVVGSVGQADHLASSIAARADAVVVSVDYRLAPGHRFPSAVDDCDAALRWAAGHATALGADPARIGVVGESAGGNLAAVVCLLARDRNGPQISHQALLYPVTDVSRPPDDPRHARTPVLTTGDMAFFRERYLGSDGDPSDPRVSPLLAPDHRGLPPALVQVAEHDPLRADGVRYAAALRAAGVPVRFTEYVGMPHGYLNLPGLCRSAPQALSEVCTEIAATV